MSEKLCQHIKSTWEHLLDFFKILKILKQTSQTSLYARIVTDLFFESSILFNVKFKLKLFIAVQFTTAMQFNVPQLRVTE